MPHHRSPKKQIRADKKRNAANRSNRAAIRSLTKKVRSSESVDQGEEALRQLLPRLDKAVKTGLLHRNTAARQKSRAQKRINTMKAGAKAQG